MKLRQQEDALTPPRVGASGLLRHMRVPRRWEGTASIRRYRWICLTNVVVEYSRCSTRWCWAGVWPTNASTTFFFLIPESTTSERPLALLPTFIRWWEWPRASTVVEWKGRHNVTWDACSKYVGGAERAGRETLLEMQTMDLEGRYLVADFAKALEKVQLSAVWKWAMCFDFPAKSAEGALWLLRSSMKGNVRK